MEWFKAKSTPPENAARHKRVLYALKVRIPRQAPNALGYRIPKMATSNAYTEIGQAVADAEGAMVSALTIYRENCNG